MKKLGLILLALVGCGSPSAPPSNPGTAALVALTDFQSPGHAARIDLRTFAVQENALPLGEDSVLKRIGEVVYVINRAGATEADNVLALSAEGLRPMGLQTSTGAGTNPQDLAVGDDGKVYVALNKGRGIAVLDLAAGQKVSEIDLSSLDPQDGIPNLFAIHRKGSLLFVFAQILDDSQTFLPARGNGKVAIWDLGANALAGVFEMASSNPYTWVQEEPGTDNLLIGMQADWSGTQGGIERIDLAARVSRGLVVTAQALGSRYVSDFVVTPEGRGYVTAVDPMSGTSSLLPFSLDGRVEAPIMVDGYFAGMALDPMGHLWVIERGFGAGATHGIRVVEMMSSSEVTRPIQTVTPPAFVQSIVFVP